MDGGDGGDSYRFGKLYESCLSGLPLNQDDADALNEVWPGFYARLRESKAIKKYVRLLHSGIPIMEFAGEERVFKGAANPNWVSDLQDKVGRFSQLGRLEAEMDIEYGKAMQNGERKCSWKQRRKQLRPR